MNMEKLQRWGTVPSRRNSKCQGPKEGTTLMIEGTERRPGWHARRGPMGESSEMVSET